MSLIVNGEAIDEALVRAEFQSLRPKYDQMMADSGMDPIQKQVQLWEWSRENVIEKVLLRQEAEKDGGPIPEAELEKAVAEALQGVGTGESCPTPANDESVRKDVEARLRLERLVNRITARVPKPKYKQIADYYAANRDMFAIPEVVRASHIVKHVNAQQPEDEARTVIEQAKAELDGGASFAEVADRFSDCPGNGGDLGYFPRGEMVEEFEATVLQLKVGERSGIFRTPFGFHIAQLADKRPASHRPLPEVKDQIEKLLVAERKEKALEDFVDRLREKAVIERASEAPAVPAGGPA